MQSLETLRANRDAARAAYERLDAEARAIRAQLTLAERKTRQARERYLAAMTELADAREVRS